MNIKCFRCFAFILCLTLNLISALCLNTDSLPVHYPLIDTLGLNFEIDSSIIKFCKKEIANPEIPWFDKSVLYTNYFASSINLFYPISDIKSIWKMSYDNDPYTSCQYVEKEYRKMSNVIYQNNIPWPLHCLILREKAFFQSYCNAINLKLDSNIINQIITIRDDGHNDREKQLAIDEIVFKIKKYPGRSTIGIDLEYVPWKIIQNGDINYLEKYLNYIKISVESHDLHPRYLAFTIDKIEVLKGYPQIYGTQSYYNEGKEELYPIKDLKNVDMLRAQMGLYPIRGSRASLGDIIVDRLRNK